jgi:hypothetical protein
MTWLALTLDYAALLAFALGMDAHHRAILGRGPSPDRRRAWKCAGGALLALALAASVWAHGIGVGVVLWFAGWAACGLLLTLLLERCPRLCALPAFACLLAAASAAANG